MRSRARAVAHGVVLVAMAGLCVTTVVSGAFDVVTVPAATAPPATAEPGAAPGSGGGADGGGDPAGPDGGTAPDATCRAAGSAWSAAAEAQLDVSVEHPQDLVDGFTTARDALAGAEPPAAVAQDWAVVTTYVTMIADAVEAAGPQDQGELARALDRVGRRIDTAALTGSSQRVTEYFRTGCPA